MSQKDELLRGPISDLFSHQDLDRFATEVSRFLADNGRKVLMERIMNHKFAYLRDGKIQLTDDTVWSTDVEHQKWLFDKSKSNSLANYSESNRSAVSDPVIDQPGTGNEKEHPGKPIAQPNDRASVVKTRDESKQGLNFYFTGELSVSGKYPYDDLYGLVKAKLEWTMTHVNEEAILLVLNFIREEYPDATTALFPDSEATAWGDLAQRFSGEPGPPDWAEVIRRFYDGGGGMGPITNHGSY